MTRDGPVSRRRVLQIVGGTVTTATIAGCTDGGDDQPEEQPEDTGDEPADGTEDNGTEDNESGNGAGGDNETDGGGDDNETDDGGDDAQAAADWEGVDEVVLEGFTENWLGVEPQPIEGEENPTLLLFDGQEYDLTWENMDGAPHNIVIWNDDDEVVEDYQTEIMEEEGESQTLTIEVSEEMAQYVCEVHAGTMIGDIDVQPANGG